MISLALIGTGGMANMHAASFAKLPGCKVVAACDVDAERVKAFAEKHHIERAFTSVEALLDWGKFDAVSNVTPDAFHAPISIAALRQGKHVLCEKPLAVCYAEAAHMAEEAAAAARKNGCIHMVNFSYRNRASIHHAHTLVASGQLGEIRHVQAAYLQSWLAQNSWGDWKTTPGFLWRLSTAHGSLGVLGDIGVHLLDFASYPVGPLASVNCRLKTFPKAPGDQLGEYKLDANDSAIVTAEFANGAIGSLQMSRWATGYHNAVTLSVFGTEGALQIDLDVPGSTLMLCKIENGVSGPWTPTGCPETPSMYERFLESIRTGQNDQPDFARGAEIQRALDACMQSDREGRTIALG